MKNTYFNILIIFSLFILGATEISAQKKGTKQRTSGTTNSTTTVKSSEGIIPNLYLGFGGGWNYQSGIIGLETEFPLGDKFSIDAAGGLGVGRYKASVGVNYFFKSVAKGFSTNAGFTYTSNLFGAGGSQVTGPIPSGDLSYVDTAGNPVDFNGIVDWTLSDVPSFDLGLAYNAKVGDKSKFVITLGYAIPFKSAYVLDLPSDIQLDSATKIALGIVSPGGFMLGYKFIFGIGG